MYNCFFNEMDNEWGQTAHVLSKGGNEIRNFRPKEKYGIFRVFLTQTAGYINVFFGIFADKVWMGRIYGLI